MKHPTFIARCRSMVSASFIERLLQEIRERLPGREWKETQARATDVPTLADLLREAAEHHDHYEKTHAEHHWWDWYAPYLSARQNGSSLEEAAAAANLYMEEAFHVPPTTTQASAPSNTTISR